jgi:hypothetical protein
MFVLRVLYSKDKQVRSLANQDEQVRIKYHERRRKISPGALMFVLLVVNKDERQDFGK